MVFAPGHHVLEEGVDRDLAGEEVHAHEGHRAGDVAGLVVVLGGFLEDLLDSAGGAGGEDDAADGDGEDGVFADAVVKVFGDVRGEGGGGLVAVEPGRDAEAVVLRLREALHHLESGGEPALVAEGVGDLDHLEGFVQFGVGAPGHPGAEVRCFHGAGAAAGDHQLAVLGEALADEGDVAEGGVAAAHRMAAHHADDLVGVVVREEAVERVADGVVMQRPGEGDRQVAAPLAGGDEICIDVAVVAGGIRGFVSGIEPVVEGFGVIEFAPDLVIVHDSKVSLCEYTKKSLENTVFLSGWLK